MIGYFIVILWFLFFCVQAKNACSEKQKKKAILCFATLVVFIIMFKDNTKVPDVETYMDEFVYYNNYSSLHEVLADNAAEDPGYITLNFVCGRIVNNYYFFQFIYALIIATSLSITLKRYSNNLWLSSYFCICSSFFLLFLMRFAIAFSICLLSLKYVFGRKPVKFCCLIVLAALFHKSALIFIITYFLPYLRYNLKSILLFSICTVIVLISIEEVIGQVMIIADSRHFEAYIQDDSSISWKVLISPTLTLSMALISYSKSNNSLNVQQTLFLYMSLIAFFINIINVRGSSFSAFYRLVPYFSFSSIYVIPDALKNINKSFRIPILIVFILLSLYGLISTANSQRGFGFLI